MTNVVNRSIHCISVLLVVLCKICDESTCFSYLYEISFKFRFYDIQLNSVLLNIYYEDYNIYDKSNKIAKKYTPKSTSS